MTCARTALVLVLATTLARDVRAVQVDALAPAREWQIGKLEFQGNHALRASQLRDAMTTRARPWYQAWQVWKSLPAFEPATFRADLDRLRQLYRNAGYYDARIEHDVGVPAEGNVVQVVVRIDEGEPVRVGAVAVALEGEPLPAKDRDLLLRDLPLKRGDVFTQDAYGRTFTVLRTYYREHAFARVDVTRRARVDVARHTANVEFRVVSGPPSVFGDVHVSAAHDVDPDVVRREVAFHRGEPFKQSLVERTRSNLVALRIFSSVRITEEKSADPVVDVDIQAAAGPTREVRLGIGYDTEEQVRGIASWRDYDFGGGARQLGFTARASFVRRTLAADFLQPHFPGLRDRIRVVAFEQEEDEETYTNDRTRFSPRIEWQALPELTPYAFYRIEYDSLSGVNPVVKARFPQIAPSNGVLSGLGFGVEWNGTNDPTDPSRGWGANALVEPVGGFLGGDVGFVRLVVEARRYQPLPERFLAALRVRVGTEELMGGTPDVPLFERFYAGGLNSVRGYARRRVGPLVDDDPIGGKSLLDGSAELRHPVTEQIGAAVFFDAGEVALASHDYPLDALRYGTGFGVFYKSPVGPLRLDLGFPVNPPSSEPRWQVHVAIGQTF